MVNDQTAAEHFTKFSQRRAARAKHFRDFKSWPKHRGLRRHSAWQNAAEGTNVEEADTSIEESLPSKPAVINPHQRCGYSDAPFARIHYFYTAGSRNELEGMGVVGWDTRP